MLKRTVLCSALLLTSVTPFTASFAAESATVANAVNDTAITAKVKALYAQAPEIKVLDISVSTANQTVVLTGEVATDSQYEKAISIAESVHGVSDVNADNLSVKSSTAPLSDTYITAKVKGSLMREKLFGKEAVEVWPVTVETKEGVVYLTGTVNSAQESANIVKIANAVKGVRSVNSALTVK